MLNKEFGTKGVEVEKVKKICYITSQNMLLISCCFGLLLVGWLADWLAS